MRNFSCGELHDYQNFHIQSKENTRAVNDCEDVGKNPTTTA